MATTTIDARFRLHAESRFPKLPDYDQSHHTYKDRYLNPALQT
jgi:hypothetical protein